MKQGVKIVIAEDDEGHATLIKKNLKRAGIRNEFIHLKDGQETLDYLFQRAKKKRENGVPILLLLDLKMPKVDGVEVLRQVKADPELRKMPVIIITTTDDPREVEKCHELGCSSYITKPIDYKKFVKAIRKLGLFLLVVEVPTIDGKDNP
ncbi:MAG: response regulator [Candidatus Aminicenantes bacterium]|nr:response regulator [Candidatus Aminicenantes bacterium]